MAIRGSCETINKNCVSMVVITSIFSISTYKKHYVIKFTQYTCLQSFPAKKIVENVASIEHACEMVERVRNENYAI